MRDVLRFAAFLAALVWWAPTLLFGAAMAWGISHRLRRVDRLLDAGQTGEALRVYAAVEREIGSGRYRARGQAGQP